MGPRRDASGGSKFVCVSVPRGGALFSQGAEADDASLGKARSTGLTPIAISHQPTWTTVADDLCELPARQAAERVEAG